MGMTARALEVTCQLGWLMMEKRAEADKDQTEDLKESDSAELYKLSMLSQWFDATLVHAPNTT